MKIKISKCDYCHKDHDDLDDLFGLDACHECYLTFWYGLSEKLSRALEKFVDKKGPYSDVLNTFCDKCKADYDTAEYIEEIHGHEITGFSIPKIQLSLSFYLCEKCSDEVFKIFKKIAAEMLDRYRVKYKEKDIVKLTYINELFQFSEKEKAT